MDRDPFDALDVIRERHGPARRGRLKGTLLFLADVQSDDPLSYRVSRFKMRRSMTLDGAIVATSLQTDRCGFVPRESLVTDVLNLVRPSRGRTIAYWVTTAIIVLVWGAGGIADVLRLDPVVKTITDLGYPPYVGVILGVWKLLGAVALLLPGTPRLKEWAYAGTVFDLTGAAASHLANGDDPTKLVFPILLTGVAFASWALRPPSRRDLMPR